MNLFGGVPFVWDARDAYFLLGKTRLWLQSAVFYNVPEGPPFLAKVGPLNLQPWGIHGGAKCERVRLKCIWEGLGSKL